MDKELKVESGQSAVADLPSGGTLTLRVEGGSTYSSKYPTQPGVITLRGGSAGQRLLILVAKGRQVEIRGCRDTPKLAIAVEGRGRVVIRDTPLRSLESDGPDIELLLDDHPGWGPSVRAIGSIRLRSGSLRLQSRMVSKIMLHKGTKLTCQDSEVSVLRFVRQGMDVNVQMDQRSIAQLLAVGPEPADGSDLKTPRSTRCRPDVQLLRGSVVRARQIAPAHWVLNRAARMIASTASGSCLHGHGTLRIEDRATSMHFVGRNPDARGRQCPIVELAKHAVLEGATGSIALAECTDSTILGAKDKESLALEQFVADGETRGLTLIDVKIPYTPDGVKSLQSLDRAVTDFVPVLDDDLRYRLHLDKAAGATSHNEAERATHYLKLLATLTQRYCTRGEQRAKVNWLLYRSLHRSTTSPLERLLFFGYRMVGYGERYWPSFLTFLVGGFIITCALSFGTPLDISAQGFRNFASRLWDIMLSPLYILKLTSASPFSFGVDVRLETLLRALLVVPLVTGFLALRKSLKPGTGDRKDDGS